MPEEKESASEVKKNSGLDFKIVLVGLLIFLLAMGGSYFLMKSLMTPLLPKVEEQKHELPSGTLVEVGELLTNVNDMGGTRYIKVKVYLEVSDEKVVEQVNNYMPVIRDSMLNILSSKTVADLDVRNRENLKNEIIRDLNGKIGDESVRSIYFSDFIMQ